MDLLPIARHLFLTKNQLRFVNIFWIGFLIYTIAGTATANKEVDAVRYQFLQLIGIGIFSFATVNLIEYKLENRYLRTIFPVYLFWIFFVVIRGVTTDYTQIKFILFDAWFGMFLHLVPLVLLFPKNLAFYKKAFAAIVIANLIFLLYDIKDLGFLMNPDGKNLDSQAIVEFYSKNLGIPSAFLLFTYMYHSRKVVVLSLITLGATLFFSIVRARRGLILMTVMPVMVAYILHLYHTRKKFLTIFITVLAGFVIVALSIELYNENRSGSFRLLSERGMEDTRSGVEDCFYKDLELVDWVIGRGMTGTYYCAFFDEEEATGIRYTIETDYLNVILKGGLIGLILLLLFLVPAAYLGLFRSKNMLSKAAAVWILFFLLSMYPATVVTFNLNYILVWICVGICYSKGIRNLPDKFVRNYYKKDYGKDKMDGLS